MPHAAVLKLSLSRFRSYPAAQVAVEARAIVLTGPNGAGKTNILEALSFLSPGRGLRRAQLADVGHRPPGAHMPNADGPPWAVSAFIEGALGEVRLGTGHDPAQEGGQRRCRIDGESVPSANAFLDHLKVLWLTPEMDGLFLGPPGDRRRYLDRLVLAVDAAPKLPVWRNGRRGALKTR